MISSIDFNKKELSKNTNYNTKQLKTLTRNKNEFQMHEKSKDKRGSAPH
jgi:hypothetical protein